MRNVGSNNELQEVVRQNETIKLEKTRIRGECHASFLEANEEGNSHWTSVLVNLVVSWYFLDTLYYRNLTRKNFNMISLYSLESLE